MSFRKHTDYGSKKDSKKISVRFKRGNAYLSVGFVRRASRLLASQGTLEENGTVRYVEFWYDQDTREIGIKPVGNKGLTDQIMMSRDGIRKVTGAKNYVVSVVAFQARYEIPDGSKIALEERLIEYEDKKVLPTDQRSFTLFVGKIPMP